jgi:cytochrome o ubiquinol oxidase subunit 2
MLAPLFAPLQSHLRNISFDWASESVFAMPHMFRSVRSISRPALGAGVLFVLTGCSKSIFNPAGPIADAERIILLDSVAIMLAIGIPAIVGILAFAWWFRASNSKAKRLGDWSYSGRLELLVWSVPALMVLFLGGIAWVSSHNLDPARPIDSSVKPLEVQVVSLDWKWLFIYPEQGIASVNRLVVPAHVPVHLRLTSASVMNVFFVPRIASEIYTMNGMTTQLNLEADRPGTYPGLSAHFSGDGFSGMAFNLEAMPQAQFTAWTDNARKGGETLDDTGYRRLLKQSNNIKPYTYRTVRSGLFDDIVGQKLPSGEGPKSKEARPEASVQGEN